MTPHDFISKWRNGGDERRDAQPFFEDVCRLIGRNGNSAVHAHGTRLETA